MISDWVFLLLNRSMTVQRVLSCLPLLVSAWAIAGCVSEPTMETFRTDDPPCYDRSIQPQTAVVDTHVHFRPFGGSAIPFAEVVSYLEGNRRPVCQHLWHRPNAAIGFRLHLLFGLSRNAGDANVEE